jgi:hypothetical protein
MGKCTSEASKERSTRVTCQTDDTIGAARTKQHVQANSSITPEPYAGRIDTSTAEVQIPSSITGSVIDQAISDQHSSVEGQ